MTQKPGSRGGPGEPFGLDFPEVKEWLFCPGMVFQATGKWWGDKTGSRPRPHEGLDLLIYRDLQGAIRRLNESTLLPVISDGVVVGRIPDFLGESIIVEHRISDTDKDRHYSIYAHTRPLAGISAGTRVNRGSAIATLALPGRSRFPMMPHLHLSVAWASCPISCDRLTWDAIAAQRMLTLLDPLIVIAFDHKLLGREDPACRVL